MKILDEGRMRIRGVITDSNNYLGIGKLGINEQNCERRDYVDTTATKAMASCYENTTSAPIVAIISKYVKAGEN